MHGFDLRRVQVGKIQQRMQPDRKAEGGLHDHPLQEQQLHAARRPNRLL